MKRLRRTWNNFSIFVKIYIISIILTASVVIFGEGSEYLALPLLNQAGLPGTPEQREVVIWLLAIALSSLIGGYIVSRITTSPLKRLQARVQELSRGNLETRLHGPDLKRHDEIGQLARGFNQMSDSLNRLLESERRLLRDISHEMRSPLARLRMSLALLEKKVAPESAGAAAEYMAQMDKDIARMDEMVELLLERARLEAGRIGEMRWLDLSRLLSDSVRSFSFPGPGEGKSIVLKKPEGPAICRGNPQRLGWVIDNLLKNALRHTAPGTAVEARLLVKAPEITLEILDRGPGVPEEQLEGIFLPFYQVASSRKRGGEGFGLGLTIARQVVANHGGWIQAANVGAAEGGRGLKVVVGLPAAETGTAADSGAAPAPGA